MRIPYLVRRRFEKLARFPDGLLALGDAVCTLNPLLSGGVLVAAEQALVLDACLGVGLPGVRRAYFRGVARVLARPWWLNAASDLTPPGARGPRVPHRHLMSWYRARLAAAATHDADVAALLFRTANATDSPTRLLRPTTLVKAIRAA